MMDLEQALPPVGKICKTLCSALKQQIANEGPVVRQSMCDIALTDCYALCGRLQMLTAAVRQHICVAASTYCCVLCCRLRLFDSRASYRKEQDVFSACKQLYNVAMPAIQRAFGSQHSMQTCTVLWQQAKHVCNSGVLQTTCLQHWSQAFKCRCRSRCCVTMCSAVLDAVLLCAVQI